MYDASKLKEGLIGLVGWKQNPNPGGEQLLEMLTSESAIWYNAQHPLITIENLLSIAPEFDRYVFPDWNVATAYTVGKVIKDGGNLFEALTAQTGSPTTTTTDWKPYSPFTAWLKEMTEDSIIEAIGMWHNKKVNQKTARNLLSRQQLFDVTGDMTDIQTNEGKVVGREIVPSKSLGLIVTLTELSIQLDTNQTIEILLFESGKVQPVKTHSIIYDQNGGVQWATVDWVLEGGKSYWVAYDESGITGNSINGIKDHTFNSKGSQYPMGRYFKTRAFNVDGSVSELWDISKNAYTQSTNYGINMKADVRCDYTALVLEQKLLFKHVISKKVAIDVLRELATNPNSKINANESNVNRDRVLYYIDGDTQATPGNKTGLAYELDQAIKAVTFDATGIDKTCLPCRKRGVTYRTV